MRFIPNQLSKRFGSLNLWGQGHIRRRPYILPILGLLAGVAIFGGVVIAKPSSTLRPSDNHIVFLSDKGQRRTLDTNAKTVGELVSKLPLHLIPQDVVEPSADTKIVQDNFRINIYRARPVTIINGDGTKAVAVTAQRSPRVVAQAAGLTVYPEDYVSFAPGSVQENIIGEKVVIDPATPVQFNLYGTQLTVRTHVKTVAELLAEKNVKLAKGDTVQPAETTPVTTDMQVFVIRNGTQIETDQEDIAAPTQYIDDSSLTFGATAVRQEGAAGKKAVTYQVTTQNGVVTTKTVIQEVIISQPVAQIIARGTIVDIAGNKTSLMAAAGISGGDYGYADYIISHESNWNPQAQNYSGAYGLCQALPGSKMVSAGADWASNPITQLRWCNGYAVTRYGGWYGAYSHWVSYRNW